MIQIRFHPRYREPIEAGTKRFTIRFNPGYDPEPGHRIELVDHELDLIRVVHCRLNATVPAGYVPRWKFHGHRAYTDLADLREELAEFYPDSEIDAHTPLKVIGW